MSKKTVKKNVKKKRDAVNPWDEAISDAEWLIENLKGRIRNLRGAIIGFKDMRDSGELWPGTSEATEKESQRASST